MGNAAENMDNAVLFNAKDRNNHANSIIESRQEFSMLEKKMIYCIINQIDGKLAIQEDLFQNMYFKIPVSTFGVDYSFRTLKLAINKITTRSITGGDNKKQHAFSIAPIPFAEVKNGVVTLMVQAKAVPLFIDLKTRGYTSYQLDIALSLTSAYSQRLYELLSRYKNTEHKKYYESIDKLKFLLGIDKDKTFKGPLANGNLKSKVIEPAMKELAEKTDIEFDYILEKTGKKFTDITFHIKPKKYLEYQKTEDAKEDAALVYKQLQELNNNDIVNIVYKTLPDYNFTPRQKDNITKSPEMMSEFLKINVLIITNVLTITKNKTAYMAKMLQPYGLNK